MGKGILIASFVGIILASYALYVEHQTSVNPNYEALCDVSVLGKMFSCSKVFNSEYGHLLFGVPNAAWGLVFYIAAILYNYVTFIPFRQHLFLLANLVSTGFTVYLATCLIRLGDFCIVCTSTYVVNAILMYLSVQEVKSAGANKAKTY
mmetsp:Transcript_10308/g.14951  ORF Transcript_10308/g.14951 Transcript_10308/m.14951 type:complete len:149 (+) Transcript_10308:118-564(+)|eukprot:CAMPEP_0175089374 /NCGR_PEP_ID=MMETSP0086_2-20121207/751_1 /TAXON_ID=136419 /ORGANISM="Unknown Unknown, Strain D1" /LENGTH=148 /DNA_ID=CAMNT_0016361877 /DNA_START=118 /DNA_END=564 /DNA_ORIENTATION=+